MALRPPMVLTGPSSDRGGWVVDDGQASLPSSGEGMSPLTRPRATVAVVEVGSGDDEVSGQIPSLDVGDEASGLCRCYAPARARMVWSMTLRNHA